MSGNQELVRLIDTIARDKAIDQEILFESIEIAMIAAARKKYEDAVSLDVTIDRSTGAISGNHDGTHINTDELGRIAAQTAKQVIIQKIREAEQDRIFVEFVDRKGEMVAGTIQRFEGENIIINLSNTESILPRHERVRTETYHVGDRIRAIIADVRKVGNRVRIVLSRTHPDLIRRLFELEIPEIADHVIEIKAIAREPGFRTKLSVVSFDAKVDCVGACVGMRGSRIRNIIDELNGEKIDIIRWNDSPEVLIMNSLKPAEIMSITLDDETMEAVVAVADDQLSLAIGKRGQNVRLAARLTGWDVNIVSATGGPVGKKPPAPSEGEGANSQLSEAEQRVLETLVSESESAQGSTEGAAEGTDAESETPSTAAELFKDGTADGETDETPAPTTAEELFAPTDTDQDPSGEPEATSTEPEQEIETTPEAPDESVTVAQEEGDSESGDGETDIEAEGDVAQAGSENDEADTAATEPADESQETESPAEAEDGDGETDIEAEEDVAQAGSENDEADTAAAEPADESQETESPAEAEDSAGETDIEAEEEVAQAGSENDEVDTAAAEPADESQETESPAEAEDSAGKTPVEETKEDATDEVLPQAPEDATS